MATKALTPLANLTLGSTSASVTFSSISGAYRDLLLVMNPGSTAGGILTLTFNSDSSGYSYVEMRGNGSAAASSANSLNYFGNTDTSITGMNLLHVMDYSATDKHKTYLSRTDVASGITRAWAGRWANTAAITSLKIEMTGADTFLSGSTFALYGVSA